MSKYCLKITVFKVKVFIHSPAVTAHPRKSILGFIWKKSRVSSFWVTNKGRPAGSEYTQPHGWMLKDVHDEAHSHSCFLPVRWSEDNWINMASVLSTSWVSANTEKIMMEIFFLVIAGDVFKQLVRDKWLPYSSSFLFPSQDFIFNPIS